MFQKEIVRLFDLFFVTLFLLGRINNQNSQKGCHSSEGELQNV